MLHVSRILRNCSWTACLLFLLASRGLIAQTPPPAAFNEELKRQQSIYQSDKPAGYVTDRSIFAYIEALHPELDRTLALLQAGDRWLDIGAGEAQAILDYHTPEYDAARAKLTRSNRGKASALALSIEDRRTARWHETAARLEKNKIQYLFGRSFREFSAQELGPFQLITDMIGGFSYTTRIDTYMVRALEILVTGGSLFTLLQDVHGETAGNKPYYPNAPYLTELARADGSELKICTWLKRIACAEVTCEMRMNWKPPVEIYHVRKTCDQVKVPPLVPIHFAAGTPPERRYAVLE